MKKGWSGKKYRPLSYKETRRNNKKERMEGRKKGKREYGRQYKCEKEKWMNIGGVEMKYM